MANCRSSASSFPNALSPLPGRIRLRRDPGKQRLAFLENHREAILALDFFTVPTVTFQSLADWVIQQLRDAFPEAGPIAM
jgi:hypothetical protein